MSEQPPESPEISILVPILNEEGVLRETLPPILGQALDGITAEFLLLDGGSEDGTLAIIAELAGEDGRVRVIDNPGRLQAHALNIGLAAARAPLVCRMDAHTFYPPGYVAAGVERWRRGDAAWVAGPAIPVGVDPWSERIAIALRSPLGVGGASFRSELSEEIESDAAFGGVAGTELLRELGGWDEDWTVNEDGELAARFTAAGGRILCIPAMRSEIVPRGSLEGLARQYWRYGRGRAKTWRRHPGSLRRSHVLPPGLVLTTAGALAGPRPTRRLARAGLAAYAAALAAGTAQAYRREDDPQAAWLPLVFATMHLSWGAGFIAGALRP